MFPQNLKAFLTMVILRSPKVISVLLLAYTDILWTTSHFFVNKFVYSIPSNIDLASAFIRTIPG